MHAANRQSPRGGQTTYKHAMKLCYMSFSSHRKLGLSQREEGCGVGVLPVRWHWEEDGCKLILDQNQEQQGSIIIFRALQDQSTAGAWCCELWTVSQTSTVNIEVMFVLCKSCNNYKLLENLVTKLCSYKSLVKLNFYFIWNPSHLMAFNAINCVQSSGEICVNVMIFLKLLICAECQMV